MIFSYRQFKKLDRKNHRYHVLAINVPDAKGDKNVEPYTYLYLELSRQIYPKRHHDSHIHLHATSKIKEKDRPRHIENKLVNTL